MNGNNSGEDSIQNPYRRKKRRLPSHSDVATSSKSSSVPHRNLASTAVVASDLIIAASDKAGMEGIDRSAIDAIILKESGNSLFMQQQRRRDDKVNDKIYLLRKKLETHQANNENKDWRRAMERQVDTEVLEWLATRPARCCKVVIDMDMFYMACELLTRPDITDTTPACVGGKSMICTSNYAARRYGVRAAMPGYIGEALVRQLSKGKEQLIFCKLNFPLYQEKSRLVRLALSEFDAHLTAYSLDDVYMDLGPYLLCSLLHPSWTHEQIASDLATARPTKPRSRTIDGTAWEVDDEMKEHGEEAEGILTDSGILVSSCQEQLLAFAPATCLARLDEIVADMRQRVFAVTGGLTCSAGIAPNFLLAKIASDRIKPNGQMAIASDHEAITTFLHPLPIRKISGIGRVTEKILKAFGIATVEQLYAERSLIRLLFDRGASTANFLLKASVGCSSSDGAVLEDEPAAQKGISRERTMRAGKPWDELLSKLNELACLISDDLKKKHVVAQTITIKVKLHTFDCLSRSKSLPQDKRVQSAADLMLIATDLLTEVRSKATDDCDASNSAHHLFSVRLLGIRCSNLHSEDAQSRSNQKTILEFLSENQSLNRASTSSCTATCQDSCVGGTEGSITEATTPETHNDKLAASPGNVRAECPICGRVFRGDIESVVNAKLNDHIDTCLNANVVREAIHEESTRERERSKSPKRSKGLYAFFGSNTTTSIQ